MGHRKGLLSHGQRGLQVLAVGTDDVWPGEQRSQALTWGKCKVVEALRDRPFREVRDGLGSVIWEARRSQTWGWLWITKAGERLPSRAGRKKKRKEMRPEKAGAGLGGSTEGVMGRR